jgi:hypothetical protein
MLELHVHKLDSKERRGGVKNSFFFNELRAAARGSPMEVGLGRGGAGAGPYRALVAAPGAWGCWWSLGVSAPSSCVGCSPAAFAVGVAASRAPSAAACCRASSPLPVRMPRGSFVPRFALPHLRDEQWTVPEIVAAVVVLYCLLVPERGGGHAAGDRPLACTRPHERRPRECARQSGTGRAGHCAACAGMPETTMHVYRQCPRYAAPRAHLTRAVDEWCTDATTGGARPTREDALRPGGGYTTTPWPTAAAPRWRRRSQVMSYVLRHTSSGKRHAS